MILAQKKSDRTITVNSTSEVPPQEATNRQAEIEACDRCCHQIFAKLRPTLIENHYNWFILIEPDSEDYFLDGDELIAFGKAREKYPQGRFFFFRLNETGISGRI